MERGARRGCPFFLPARHSLDLAQIGPADPQRLAIVQLGRPHAESFMAQAADSIAAQDRRAVDADESRGVELPLQSRDRLQQQVATLLPIALVDVEPDIVALGIDPLDLNGVDPQKLGTVGHPEFGEPVSLACYRLAAMFAAHKGAIDRPLEPLDGNWLEDIVDRFEIERLDREE